MVNFRSTSSRRPVLNVRPHLLRMHLSQHTTINSPPAQPRVSSRRAPQEQRQRELDVPALCHQAQLHERQRHSEGLLDVLCARPHSHLMASPRPSPRPFAHADRVDPGIGPMAATRFDIEYMKAGERKQKLIITEPIISHIPWRTQSPCQRDGELTCAPPRPAGARGISLINDSGDQGAAATTSTLECVDANGEHTLSPNGARVLRVLQNRPYMTLW